MVLEAMNDYFFVSISLQLMPLFSIPDPADPS